MGVETMPINSCDYWFSGLEKWTVVSDSNLAWRSSPNYEDKNGDYEAVGPGTRITGSLVDGDGPGKGEEGNWSGELEYWFIKAQPVQGEFAFLPVNSSSLRPMMRCLLPMNLRVGQSLLVVQAKSYYPFLESREEMESFMRAGLAFANQP